ncbi:hypothetical protein AB0B83_26060 [Micromonospora sp. NPDC049060]|uniref:hypothetical protein n=1 Tax=Micromonospora sp. NPDC049060 TaxID=3154828 RepID=UPI0033C70C49
MGSTPLYPDPPHLTVAVFPASSDEPAFPAVCDSLVACGAQPAGVLETISPDVDFEAPSDVAETVASMTVASDSFQRIIRGGEPAKRPVRAGFTRGGEVVVVGLLRRNRGERFPVGVSCFAGALGLPIDLWREADRSAAFEITRWSRRLLQAMTGRLPCAYGSIEVEAPFPTPSMLRSGAMLGSEVFVARDVLARRPELRAALAEDYDDVGEEWEAGTFFSGWAPFDSARRMLPYTPDRYQRSSRLLGESLSS